MDAGSSSGLAALFAAPAAADYAAYAGIGSRKTPPEICKAMTDIGRALEGRGFTLRSGGAPAADQAFETGTSDERLREIYLPAKGWRGSASQLYPEAIGPELWKQARDLAERFHPAWRRVRPGYAQALQTRNTFQVLGKDLCTPARFVIAWTEDGQASGGTGQAIRVARARGIPVFNLQPAVLAAVREALDIQTRSRGIGSGRAPAGVREAAPSRYQPAGPDGS